MPKSNEELAKLRSKVDLILQDFLSDYIQGYENSKAQGLNLEYCTFDTIVGFLDGITSLLTTSQREAELRARLDERKRVADTNVEAAGLDYKYPNIGFAAAITVVNSERIIELEAQLKDTTKGEHGTITAT